MNGTISLEKGTILSGCTVLEKIGEGGMGSVYKAHDPALDRIVAVKIMNASSDAVGRERFLREAKLLAQCRHPGVVQIHAFGEYQGFPYFVMEHVEGTSLDTFIKKAKLVSGTQHNLEELLELGYLKESPAELPYFLRDPLNRPLEDAEYIGRVGSLIAGIADTLAEVHRLGIMHRDIKPSNILICRDGAVKLVDFGLALSGVEHDLTRIDQILGTLNYMAPEQFMGSKGKITSGTDIFSLGVVYYELCTLHRPIEETEPAAVVGRITRSDFQEPRSFNPNISKTVNHIIMKCLQSEQNQRYASATLLASEIRAAESVSPIVQNIKDFFHDASVLTPPVVPEKRQRRVSTVRTYVKGHRKLIIIAVVIFFIFLDKFSEEPFSGTRIFLAARTEVNGIMYLKLVSESGNQGRMRMLLLEGDETDQFKVLELNSDECTLLDKKSDEERTISFSDYNPLQYDEKLFYDLSKKVNVRISGNLYRYLSDQMKLPVYGDRDFLKHEVTVTATNVEMNSIFRTFSYHFQIAQNGDIYFVKLR
ncbi:MAG: serine/threonine-protein kinase [Candidatus Wallbacteria bacterium]|nr:serine/threonine-protein kinase [Candidatus Wallbacteria bacterium]